MNIGIIGVGYVGAVTGTCFAYMGHRVVCCDTDEKKINAFKSGHPPFYEPGLENYLSHPTTQKNISFTHQLIDVVETCKIIFLCIGTPSTDAGDVDLSYLYNALGKMLPLMRDGQSLVLKSTVPIGTAAYIRTLIKKPSSKDIRVISNPEFLKEGTAINDFLKPDRIVLGVQDTESEALMRKVYEPLTRNGHPILIMDNASAELSKYACNAMLATRISFINEVARLCEVFGANIQHVRQSLTTDPRIGPKFLYPSLGYGGSCFPKDIKGLIHQATQKNLTLPLIAATEMVNMQQKEWLFRKFQRWNATHQISHVAVWGTAFKPETDDIRESGALVLIRHLLDAGLKVHAHDPIAHINTQKYFQGEKNFEMSGTDHLACLKKSQALFICTEWQLYQNTPIEEITQHLRAPTAIFDGRNIFYAWDIPADVPYFGIGQSNIDVRDQELREKIPLPIPIDSLPI